MDLSTSQPEPLTSAMPATKQARADVSTQRLLDAAQELIGEVGYNGATLALIAKRAGYSHGLITRRFGSKERLLYALVERMTVTWWAQEARPQPDAHGREAVLASLAFILAGYRRSPSAMRGLYLVMFEALNSEPALREPMVELHRRFRESVAAHVREGIAEGSISPAVDPERIGRLLVSGLRGIAYQWMLDPDEFGIETAVADLRDTMERLLPASPEGVR